MAAFFKSDELKDIIRTAVFNALKDDLIGLKDVVDEAVKRATTDLETRVQKLEAQCEVLRSMINDNEQYSRKYNLTINGIKETGGENCVGKVIDLCKTKLNIVVGKESFDRAHRLGPKKPGRERQIIAKFIQFNVKNAIYRNRKLLKGTDIFISDDLSNCTLNLLKQAKSCDPVKSAWSSDCKILAKDEHDKIHRIRKFPDLESFGI